jgi:hypothetical protein
MDCYIIRIYRHILAGDAEGDEVAGLVERVGRRGNSKPFSSYKSLVKALRAEVSGTTDTGNGGNGAAPQLRVVDTKTRG